MTLPRPGYLLFYRIYALFILCTTLYKYYRKLTNYQKYLAVVTYFDKQLFPRIMSIETLFMRFIN